MSDLTSLDEGSGAAFMSLSAKPKINDYKIETYDFRQPKLVSKEIMRVLYEIHNQFGRNLKRIFTNSLNTTTEVTIQSIQEVIFAEFINKIQPPAALFLFSIEELGDWAVLQLDPAFCIFFVEQQSGGRSIKLGSDRTLTQIEERVMGRTIEKILTELTHIWSSYIDMTVIHHVYESKPANIRTISSHIPGIAVTFKLKVENLEIPFRICYPHALIKEQMSSYGKIDKNDDKEELSAENRLQFKDDMKRVNISTATQLGKTKISLNDLLSLSEGDTLKLNQHIEDPLQVLVNNKPKMLGYPGTIGSNRAVKIYDILKSDL